MKESRNVNIDAQNRVVIRIPARDRDDLKLVKGDTYKTKVDKRKRRLIICFEQEDK
jgi:bifunctional DNA-binding transcriptional regulator/antitoxin component of YhaV-PrlF toxin-antitoxin module